MTDHEQATFTYLMCRPTYFDVTYRINPWMDPSVDVDTSLAMRQWQKLHDSYVDLGHTVELVDPLEGYPDMVFTANGGFTLDGIAYGPKFTFEERGAEAPAFMEWFADNGFEVVVPQYVNEGEGDLLLSGNWILAGTGFRTDPRSHAELAEAVNREVVTLNLVNPAFYHLDTAISILDPVEGTEHPNIAYVESAFDERSLGVLRERYPDAIVVGEQDASVLGLNSTSDGRNVLIAQRATEFEAALRDHGYNPIGLDLSEFLRSGGGIKCCTLLLRR